MACAVAERRLRSLAAQCDDGGVVGDAVEGDNRLGVSHRGDGRDQELAAGPDLDRRRFVFGGTQRTPLTMAASVRVRPSSGRAS